MISPISRRIVAALGAAAACLATPAGDPGRTAMKLSSPAFEDGGSVPRVHTCDGDDLSPPLEWTGAPKGTRSFALILDDPDAPPGTWVHWVLYDLPGDLRSLPEGVPEEATLTSGARHGQCWGVDRFSRIGYHGPCPPPGKPHRYVFRIFALDTRLDLPARATKAELEAAMRGHVLEQATLTGRYGR